MDIKKNFLNILLSLSVFGLLLAGYFRYITAYTQDLGRHLLTGKMILETFSVPSVNLFSYTNTSFPFTNHHALAEVIIYIVFSLFGNNGLQILTLLLVFLAFGFLYFYAARRYSYIAASVVSFLYLGILFERTDIRPELFSFLFLSLFMLILFKNREKFTKLVYLLPLLSFVWVNTHIYFFVGIVILVLFLIDAFFQKKESFKKLSIVLGLCFLATTLNPHFIEGAIYPLKVFENYGYSIEENQTIFLLESLGFEKTSVTYLKIAVFFLFLTLILNFRKKRAIDWLLAIVFTYAAFVAVRNLPLFVFATFIPFSKNLFDISRNSASAISKRYSYALPVLILALILLFVFATVKTGARNDIGFGVAPGAERGVDFFQINNITGPIFNNFDIGSYLLYRLYPSEKVFIDGRPEAYPVAFIQETYIPMQEDMNTFEKVDKKYNFQTIFFSHTDMTPWGQKFISEIVKNKDWKTVYLDETSIILLKDTKQNEMLIKKYSMSYPEFRISSSAKTNMQSLLKLANFFQTVGAPDEQLGIFQKILVIDPGYCPVLYNMAIILSQKNDSGGQIFAQRYRATCEKQTLGL